MLLYPKQTSCVPPAAPLRRGGVCGIVAHALLTFATRVPSLRSPELFFSSHFGGKVLLRKKMDPGPISHRWHATCRSINGFVTIRAFTAALLRLFTHSGLAGREFHQRLCWGAFVSAGPDALYMDLFRLVGTWDRGGSSPLWCFFAKCRVYYRNHLQEPLTVKPSSQLLRLEVGEGY